MLSSNLSNLYAGFIPTEHKISNTNNLIISAILRKLYGSGLHYYSTNVFYKVAKFKDEENVKNF